MIRADLVGVVASNPGTFRIGLGLELLLSRWCRGNDSCGINCGLSCIAGAVMIVLEFFRTDSVNEVGAGILA